MVESTLALAAASTLLVGATYAYVGLHLVRKARAERGDGRNARALSFFGGWWFATSLNQSLGGVLYLAAAFGWTDLSIQLTYVLVQRLLLALSLVGLMFYLIYLQTGRDALLPLAIVYAAYYASQVYIVVARAPIGVESFGWRTDLVYANASSPLWESLSLLIVVPPVIGALSLLRVYPRLPSPARRLRVAMIGGGFVVWWVLAVIAGQARTFDLAWLQGLNRVVGILVALGILLAYEPRPWMERRFGIAKEAI